MFRSDANASDDMCRAEADHALAGLDVMNGFNCNSVHSPATMPGDDLLFHRLSDSTIGAVGFHVRVRDGIGWDTDAMATRQ